MIHQVDSLRFSIHQIKSIYYFNQSHMSHVPCNRALVDVRYTIIIILHIFLPVYFLWLLNGCHHIIPYPKWFASDHGACLNISVDISHYSNSAKWSLKIHSWNNKISKTMSSNILSHNTMLPPFKTCPWIPTSPPLPIDIRMFTSFDKGLNKIVFLKHAP